MHRRIGPSAAIGVQNTKKTIYKASPSHTDTLVAIRRIPTVDEAGLPWVWGEPWGYTWYGYVVGMGIEIPSPRQPWNEVMTCIENI